LLCQLLLTYGREDEDEGWWAGRSTARPEAVVVLRRTLEALEAAQVEHAFVAGWSWARIAEVFGVSKQAVHKKHAKRIRDKYRGQPPRRKGKGE
jgi:DNA-directed RNA polymerase specialized sigma24 family protein